MSESFKCQFEYNGNRYDIELSEEFSPEVLFEVIFDKIKQIIQIVSNKCLSFGSQVFELMIDFDNNYTTVLTLNHLNYVIKSNALIRVSDVLNPKSVVNQSNIGSNNEPLNESTSGSQNPAQPIPSVSAFNQLISENFNYNSITNLYIKSFEEMQKFSLFILEIILYSKNNCDLIADYEWIYVIPKRMADKGFAKSGPESWRTTYIRFSQFYINTLQTCHSYNEAFNRFPLFAMYNTILFNPINSLYDRIRNSRRKYLSGLKLDMKSCAPDLTLLQTDNLRKSDENNRNRSFGLTQFQKELESNISDIKSLNLLIQLINEEKLSSDQPNKFDIIAKKMFENKLEWNAIKCSDKLDRWIKFYSQNFDNYTKALKANNRVVKYIYGYLNAIPNSIQNLRIYSDFTIKRDRIEGIIKYNQILATKPCFADIMNQTFIQRVVKNNIFNQNSNKKRTKENMCSVNKRPNFGATQSSCIRLSSGPTAGSATVLTEVNSSNCQNQISTINANMFTL